ncbi:hypothetical protein [Salinicoccus roseus]|uniref:hypothetical protein n=1 Tax=Salinicoccus roseus TaxID=45670 RepID=UPI00374335B6
MECHKFGYILVSSKDQNEGRQLEAMKAAGVKKTSFYKLVKALEEEMDNTHYKIEEIQNTQH